MSVIRMTVGSLCSGGFKANSDTEAALELGKEATLLVAKIASVAKF